MEKFLKQFCVGISERVFKIFSEEHRKGFLKEILKDFPKKYHDKFEILILKKSLKEFLWASWSCGQWQQPFVNFSRCFFLRIPFKLLYCCFQKILHDFFLANFPKRLGSLIEGSSEISLRIFLQIFHYIIWHEFLEDLLQGFLQQIFQKSLRKFLKNTFIILPRIHLKISSKDFFISPFSEAFLFLGVSSEVYRGILFSFFFMGWFRNLSKNFFGNFFKVFFRKSCRYFSRYFFKDS